MNNNKEIKEESLITEQEAWDVIKFARSMNGYGGYNVLTPDLVSARMKDVSLNPLSASQDSLNKALSDPKNSEMDLLGFSENFELISQPYKRLLSYLSNMAAWDLTYTCTNATGEEYKSKAYRNDLDIVWRFLDGFDYKQEFTVALTEILRNEAFFCLPRMDGNKMVLQELPSTPTYTKITGRWEYGMLFSFNMYWLLLPGVSHDMLPKFFRQKYEEIWGNSKSGIPKYNPSIDPTNRGDSSWVFWQDIPVDVGWCFKMSPEIATRVPYFSPLFNDLVLQSLMRNLQRNINIATASRLLIGQVGMLKDTNGKLKDQFNISPDLLGKFLSLVKSGLSEAINVAAAPLESIQPVAFNSENGMYDSFLKTALASSGVNSNLIFSSNIKPNTVETQLSLNTDEQLIYKVYPQFANFLKYQINKLTKKFKFDFEFEGTQFYNNRTFRLEQQMTLSDKGIVLPQKIAAAIGMKPQNFYRQLEEAKVSGWVEGLTPILSGFQNPNGESDSEGKKKPVGKAKEGRPRKAESELSEDGEQTRAQGNNLDRGGKI